MAAAASGGAIFLAIGFSSRKLGTALYVGLLAWGLFQVTRTAMSMALGIFAEERRNQTLGLLFLAGISSVELFAVKLGGIFLTGLFRLMAIFPCFVIPIFMARYPWSVLPATIVTLLCWFLFVLSVNVLASVIFTDESSSKMFADGLMAVLCVAAPAVNAINRLLTGGPIDPFWLTFTPARGPWLLVNQVWGGTLAGLGTANLFSFVFSLACISFAAFRLGRMWQQQTIGTPDQIWFQGLRRWRRERAETLLSTNPYAWIIAKDFRPIVAAWAAFGIVLLVWLLGLWHWSKFWLLPVNFWATCLLLGEVVRWLVCFLAARQIGEDRQSGGLEILLTSNLQIEEMVGGQELVVRRYVRPLHIVLGMIHVVFFVTGLLVRNWTAEGLASYVIVWIFVAICGPWTQPTGFWTAFWVSLHTGRPGYALRRRLLQHGGYVGVWFQVYFHFDKIATFPFGTYSELLVLLGILAVILVLLPFMRHEARKKNLKNKIMAELREVAQHPPPEPNDPRLKKWNTSESFYGEPAEPPEKIFV